MSSTNTDGASNFSEVNGLESETAIVSEPNIGRKSVVWLTVAAMVGLTASETVQHLLFPHLDSWQYQAMTIFAGTAATGICGYYLTRKIGKLFSARIQVEKNWLSNAIY
jgi:hypothetical protein